MRGDRKAAHTLTASEGTSGNEDGGVLSSERALGPETTGSVPEGLNEKIRSIKLRDGPTQSRPTFHWAGKLP